MIENFINITTKDGLIDTFEVMPDEGGPFPAIIIYMDAPAIREELRDMARRLASMGYYVLLPNLFYRVGKEGNYPFIFDKIREDKSHFTAMIKTMDDTTNELVVSDTKYILEFLDNKKGIMHEGYGAVGYCMSGQYIVSIASVYSNKFSAAASFYGVKIMTDKEDSPHLGAGKITANLYLAFAEKDSWVDDEALKNIEEHFEKNTLNFRMEIYEGTEHGFAFPDRHTYHKKGAETHWSRIHDLFQKHLK
jgi:carboxymethylenebutenolidase